MKRLQTICVFLVLFVVASVGLFGQQMAYVDKGPFPDTATFKLPGGIINGGIGVDPEGKVWVQVRAAGSDSSADLQTGVNRPVFAIYVFNKNGTQAAFSPIRILTGPDQNNVTVTDTLLRSTATGGCINRSNGNFVAVWGSLSYKPGPLIWEINYKTGAGVRRILLPNPTLQNNIASLGVNSDGEYYTSSVLSGSVGQILNADGSNGNQFSANVPAIGRTMTVSPDGNDVYCPRFTANDTYVYHSDNGSLGPFTLKDSLFHGMSTESIAIHPVTGYVWGSADGRSKQDTVSANKRSWRTSSFYAYNPSTKAIVDSFNIAAWPPPAGAPASGEALPRGIAFSPTGDTVYVGHFDGVAGANATPAVRRFVRQVVSVDQVSDLTPSGYTLSQNFPNPFNPTTQIQFTVPKATHVTLKVYDILGREVATLANEYVMAGTFRASFNASSLTSGTYIYRLVTGETQITKKMVLAK